MTSLSSVQAAFGAGSLYAIPGALSGVAVTNPTPIQFGILQDVTLDFKFDVKQLYGNRQFALKIARGKGKATWKAKSAQLQARAINDLFLNGTLTAAKQELTAIDEALTVASDKVTVAEAATFAQDLGVRNATTGLTYTRVADDTTPSSDGEYSLKTATGSYTGEYDFKASEDAHLLLVSYTYTATTGSEITIANNLMGDTPYFEVVFNTIFEGNTAQLHMLKSTMDAWNLPTKLDDWTIPDASGEFFANDANILGYLSLTN